MWVKKSNGDGGAEKEEEMCLEKTAHASTFFYGTRFRQYWISGNTGVYRNILGLSIICRCSQTAGCNSCSIASGDASN